MTDGVVLREKLRAPPVTGLARERLEQPLRDGRPSILDVVVAPAGSGKTTLMSRVLATAPTPAGWYRVTADDWTEARLVAHLAAALREVCDVGAVTSMDALLAGLDRWPGPGGLLILDDVHEITGTSAERVLERFVTLRPHRLRIILGSRRMPDINIPRIRVSGPFREIGGDDLRFRSWEAEELFASVYREPLRPDAAAALTRQTGGWAAGLQLFHLSTAGRTAGERHQAVAGLGGRSKLVRSYLTHNVLAELPEDRRRFLVRTSTLGRLSGAACDALLNIDGSRRILEQLEAAQLFTSMDDDGVHFRYHEILQTHLEMALVEEYGHARARAWYARSGVVLESLGDHRSALRAYAKAEDWPAVSRLVEQAAADRSDATAVDADHLLPASTWRQDPWLALANARRLVRDGALASAAEAYRCAKGLYDEPRFQQICSDETRAVALWLPGAADQSRLRHWSVPLRDGLRAAPDFGAVPTADARSRLAYGLAAIAAGDIQWARERLATIRSDELTDEMARIAAQLALATLCLVEAVDDAEAGFGEVAALAEDNGLPWLARLAHGLQQLALVKSQGALWRLDCCAELIRAADQRGDPWGAALLTLVVGLTTRAIGIAAEPAELVDAAARFTALDAPLLQRWCSVRSPASPDPESRSAGQVAIQCFAEYRVVIDGRAVDLSRLRPQARNVLQLLSMSPGTDQHREFLEDALWPGVDHPVACHRLQVAVSSVRSLFADCAVVIRRHGESYRLCLPTDSTVDVEEFRVALTTAAAASARGDVDARIAARQRALAVYTGDLLPDVSAEAADTERQRLKRRAAAAAAGLAADHRARGAGPEALAAAQRSIDLDPYQDRPWLLLADLHEQAGDASAAEFTRREYARIQAELAIPA